MSTTFIKRAATGAVAVSLALGALVANGTSASASFAPDRTASTSVATTYLSSTLGVPTDTVIETVTYDRFQWLLKQQGQFAFLIGSASDTNFAANAVKVDTAAKAAGASKVYWFDPNLTGQTGIKGLDIRNTGNINLAANSQTIFGNIWKNVLGQYLGNGIKSTPNTAKTSVTITADNTVVNDSVNPLWDYTSTASTTPSSTDDYFITYDKDNAPNGAADKIVSWVDLSTASDVPAALGTALTAIGGSNIDALGQFEWWKDSANAKHDLAYTDDARYGGDILNSTDNANGWVVQQITYPELLHLLAVSDNTDQNFVILFGGTWCHNTRAVLKQVNENAVRNGVTKVYNFDLVLDGGTTNGTNSSLNPIHVRDRANGTYVANTALSTFNFRPSWAYGDLVRTNFQNLITENEPNAGSFVSYYKGGDTTLFPEVVRKLQVPFLINFQKGTATATAPQAKSVKRQWIQKIVDPSTGLTSYKEYMSEQWFTTPSAQLGLAFALPTTPTAEAALSTGDKSLLDTARLNLAFGQQAIADLKVFFDGLPGAVVPTRTVTASEVAYGNASTVTLTLGELQGRTPTGNATLTVGGQTYTAAVADGKATFTTGSLTAGSKSYTISYTTDSQILGFTQSGTLSVGKTDVSSLVSKVTKAPTKKAAGSLKVTITRNTALAAVGGNIRVTLTKGAVTKVINAAVSNGSATVALPKLASGAWAVAVAYLGDSNFNARNLTSASLKVK